MGNHQPTQLLQIVGRSHLPGADDRVPWVGTQLGVREVRPRCSCSHTPDQLDCLVALVLADTSSLYVSTLLPITIEVFASRADEWAHPEQHGDAAERCGRADIAGRTGPQDDRNDLTELIGSFAPTRTQALHQPKHPYGPPLRDHTGTPCGSHRLHQTRPERSATIKRSERPSVGIPPPTGARRPVRLVSRPPLDAALQHRRQPAPTPNLDAPLGRHRRLSGDDGAGTARGNRRKWVDLAHALNFLSDVPQPAEPVVRVARHVNGQGSRRPACPGRPGPLGTWHPGR